jgi:steroid delta-isomerase-like uncharacterized protein
LQTASETLNRNTKIIHNLFDLINQTRDAKVMLDYLSDDVVYLNPATGKTDQAGMQGFHTMLFSAFPDIFYRIDRLILNGETAVIECTVSGTQKGDFAGLPPSEKEINLPVAFIVDFEGAEEGGRVKKWNSYFDTGTMMRQLGFTK